MAIINEMNRLRIVLHTKEGNNKKKNRAIRNCSPINVFCNCNNIEESKCAAIITKI